MPSQHQDRMSIEIQRILAEILRNEIKDPRISAGAVGVSRVEASGDISFARVYFSILGSDEERQDILRVLEKAKGFIRSQLARRLQIRHVPELEFRIDTSIEIGVRMSALLDELREMENGEGSQP